MQCDSLKLELLPITSTFQSKQLEFGQRKEDSSVIPTEQIQDSMISMTLKMSVNEENLQTRENLISTVESPPKNNQKIYQDKKISRENYIQTQKLSSTLDQVLIGRDLVYGELSKNLAMERSKKLSSFTKIDFADLASKSLNLSSNNMESNSWFIKKNFSKQENKKSQKTSSKLCTSSLAQSTEVEDIKKNKKGREIQELRSRKYKMILSKKQEKKLSMTMGLYRKVYNSTVDITKAQNGDPVSTNTLRQPIRDYNLDSNDPISLIPSNLRECAVFEAETAYKTSIKTLGKNTYSEIYKQLRKLETKFSDLEKKKCNRKTEEAKFKVEDEKSTVIEHIMDFYDQLLDISSMVKKLELKYRTSKSSYQVMDIPKAAIKKNGKEISVFPRGLGLKFKLKEYPNEILHNVKIIKCPIGYYLQVPFIKNEDTSPDKKFISLDPGYRTFQTSVDSEGQIIEFGKNWYENIKKDVGRLDKTNHRFQNSKCHRSSRTKKILDRKYLKIKNKITDMHRKIVSELMGYEQIIMPKLKTKEFGSLSKISNRIRHIASHCRFHDYAKMKLGDKLIDSNETFTTQTCCKCFERTNIGENKIFDCERCDFKSDRDINSAVNILIKNYNFGLGHDPESMNGSNRYLNTGSTDLDL